MKTNHFWTPSFANLNFCVGHFQIQHGQGSYKIRLILFMCALRPKKSPLLPQRLKFARPTFSMVNFANKVRKKGRGKKISVVLCVIKRINVYYSLHAFYLYELQGSFYLQTAYCRRYTGNLSALRATSCAWNGFHVYRIPYHKFCTNAF